MMKSRIVGIFFLIGFSNQSFAQTFEQIVREHYTINYETGLSTDAFDFDAYMESAVTAMTAEFQNFDPESILSEIGSCDLFLYRHPNTKAGVGFATLISGFTQNSFVCEIHFLTPVSHPNNARTSLDEPMDTAYFYKTVVHEYSTVFLDRIVDRESTWRNFYSAQNWFVQGIEEYLGLMNSSEHSRTITLSLMCDLFRANPNRVDMSFGITTTNDYIDGAILIKFIVETYGRQSLNLILSSSEPTFGRAMRSVFGDLSTFEADWTRWVTDLN